MNDIHAPYPSMLTHRLLVVSLNSLRPLVFDPYSKPGTDHSNVICQIRHFKASSGYLHTNKDTFKYCASVLIMRVQYVFNLF